MRNNIILIGYMGSGKTSVGTLYADNHGIGFLDTDAMIEEREGMTVSQIFAERGEEEFRRMETAVLKELLGGVKTVLISAGGGLPLQRENRELLKELGTVVYLDVSCKTVVERLRGDTTRPLLTGEHVEEKVKNMLRERGPIYEEAAHARVDVNGKSPEQIAEEIDALLKQQQEDVG